IPPPYPYQFAIGFSTSIPTTSLRVRLLAKTVRQFCILTLSPSRTWSDADTLADPATAPITLSLEEDPERSYVYRKSSDIKAFDPDGVVPIMYTHSAINMKSLRDSHGS